MAGLKNCRVLVTGAGGFIGSHLTRRLVHEDAEVFILTKYNSVIDNIRLVDVWDQLHVIEADIRNLDSLRQLQDVRPQLVYHLAAYNHVGDSFIHVSEALDCNCKGTANLLESYEDYDRFIYISSSEVYGEQAHVPFTEDLCPRPISPYAIGKYAGELYCRMKLKLGGRRIVVLRPFNAFGPYQSPRAVVAELVLTCLSGRPICTTKGRQTRDFNFVENLVNGFVLAAECEEAIGQVINLGSGNEISIYDLVHKVHAATESQSELHIGELEYRPTEIWRMVADHTRARQLLGWTPHIDFEEGLRRTVSWYRAFLAEYGASDSSLQRLNRVGR